MDYVPDLIPEHSRVDLNLSESIETGKKQTPFWEVLTKLFSIALFLYSLSFIFTRFWLGIFIAAIGFFIYPAANRWIEKTLRFRFSWPIKSMTILLLLCAFFATKPNYDTRDKVRAQELTMVIKQKQEEQRLIAEQKAAREKSRLDSLNYYINLSEDKKSRRRYSEAVVQLNHALRFATDIDTAIYAAKANCNFLAKNYDNAIKDYQKLVSKGKDVALNKYHIAVIYVRQSKIKEAVYELQPAMNQGHNKALALHEKINPLIREVAYYVTRCCDGSTSSAKGRGACSHHGGVCNWNDHVYREYRKY